MMYIKGKVEYFFDINFIFFDRKMYYFFYWLLKDVFRIYMISVINNKDIW